RASHLHPSALWPDRAIGPPTIRDQASRCPRKIPEVGWSYRRDFSAFTAVAALAGCLVLALSGHDDGFPRCPLLEVKPTFGSTTASRAFAFHSARRLLQHDQRRRSRIGFETAARSL